MRMTRWLAAGLGLFVMNGVAEANIIVDSGMGYFTLAGGQSALLYSGASAGSVNQIDVSFFFSPATEGGGTGGYSWPSDFALIVTAPGHAPQQWGGRDTVFPGATRVADWSLSDIPQGGGIGIFDQTYSTVLTTGLGELAGSGNWQIHIMNGFSTSEEVNYQSVRIVVHQTGDQITVPEGGGRWDNLLALAGVMGALGLTRQRTRCV
jgi:hypothetical protein